jgi:hypothetical protein
MTTTAATFASSRQGGDAGEVACPLADDDDAAVELEKVAQGDWSKTMTEGAPCIAVVVHVLVVVMLLFVLRLLLEVVVGSSRIGPVAWSVGTVVVGLENLVSGCRRRLGKPGQ